jgi:hypothetical protein
MDFYHFVVILAKNDMKDMSDFDNKFCKKRLASVHCNPIHFCCFVGKKIVVEDFLHVYLF